MDIKELKRYLYSVRPTAKLLRKTNTEHIYTCDIDQFGLNFKVPIADMNGDLFDDIIPAVDLIRWMVFNPPTETN